MNLENIAQQILAEISQAERILVIAHRNPDGDALGATSALAYYMKNLGKDVSIFCYGKIPHNLSFLPHYETISQDPELWKETFDLIIVVDSGNLAHTGIDVHLAEMAQKPKIINIDHHYTNENYGDLNLVMHSAASTTEILHKFFRFHKINIDHTLATCLLTGIVTDTDNFSNGATTRGALRAASSLISRGGSLRKIQEWIFRDKTIDSLKLWGMLLTRMEKHPELDIVYTFAKKAELDTVSEGKGDGGFANFMNNLEEGVCGLFISELEDNRIKGSFRTTRDDIDVSALAGLFGGGGHKKAAGFNVEKPLEDAIGHIFETISQSGLLKQNA